MKKIMLTKVREDAGLSKAKLSQLAEVNYTLVCRYERLDCKPYPKAMVNIANALGWDGDPAELFEEIEEVK